MFKKLIQKILPSIRYGDRIVKSTDWLEVQQIGLNQKMRDLDEKQEYLFWLNQRREGETLSQTKARVFRDLPKAEGQMRDTQLVNLYILKELQNVCRENGLSVVLMRGSLLGAVRHGGCIPWDDDIDVGMLRKDYLRLKELLRDHPELRMETCFNYRINVSRIKVRLRNAIPFFVDIFLFDFAERSDFSTEKISELHRNYARKMKTLFAKQYDLKSFCPPFLTNPEIEQALEDYYAEILLQNPWIGKGEYCIYSFCNNEDITKFVFLRDNFFPLEKIYFDGIEAEIPLNREEILRIYYGDFWCFPSKVSPKHTAETAFDPEEYKDLIAGIKAKLQLT